MFDLHIFVDGAWRLAAVLELPEAGRGFLGTSTVDYDLDYVFEYGVDERFDLSSPRDRRALSVCHPVDLESRRSERWPAFLLDLLPQGSGRAAIADRLGIDRDARSSDLPILLYSGGTIGNLRIVRHGHAAWPLGGEPGDGGVELQDVLKRAGRFPELLERAVAVPGGGSAGVQGEWPKIALVQATDGLVYLDGEVEDAFVARHLLAKFVRGKSRNDATVLRAECGYARLAHHLGLKVEGEWRFGDDVLLMERFDRAVCRGSVLRHGQESLTSAVGRAEFGGYGSHERFLETIRQACDDPLADVLEYLKRDIANLALGNPDNHGRNTALRKPAGGGIELAPLYDFAPMRMTEDPIDRKTKWACMRQGDRSLDLRPDWRKIAEVAAGDALTAGDLLEEMGKFAERLALAPSLAPEFDIPAEVVETAMRDCVRVADAVRRDADAEPRGLEI